MRPRDAREKILNDPPYLRPKPHLELRLGVQRLCTILPIEEQGQHSGHGELEPITTGHGVPDTTQIGRGVPDNLFAGPGEPDIPIPGHGEPGVPNSGHGEPGAQNSGHGEPGAQDSGHGEPDSFFSGLGEPDINITNFGHGKPLSPDSVLGHGEPGVDDSGHGEPYVKPGHGVPDVPGHKLPGNNAQSAADYGKSANPDSPVYEKDVQSDEEFHGFGDGEVERAQKKKFDICDL